MNKDVLTKVFNFFKYLMQLSKLNFPPDMYVTQPRRRWHVSFPVLKGRKHWVGDCCPCDLS